MTRINAGLNPKYFTDEQLLAEHREIKRIPWFLSRALYNSCEQTILNSIPKKFSLQEGHIKFFYDKQTFLLRRYKLIYNECLSRGFNVTDLSGSWDKVISLDDRFWQDWEPSHQDNVQVARRMQKKILISNKQWFHINHKKVSKEAAMGLLLEAVDNPYRECNQITY